MVSPRFASVTEALAELADLGMVLLVDDDHPENVGSLITAAAAATPERIGFFIRHTSGVICAPLCADRAARLGLAHLPDEFNDHHRAGFTQSVDYRHGDPAGVSAEGRALTVQALIDPRTQPSDLSRPGHIFPREAAAEGVLRVPGRAEAAVDLVRLSGLEAVAVASEVVNDSGSLARLPEILRFGEEHGIPVVTIVDLVRHRRRTEKLVQRVARASLPTRHGDFVVHAYGSVLDGEEHLALVLGTLDRIESPLVRVHSECLTGDVFGSRRCDCGMQLQLALDRIGEEGSGIIVYTRGHEGRGIGIAHKIRAYRLQEEGHDTVDANLELGFPVDGRDYTIAGNILADLGVRRLRLLTNNPAKVAGLESLGFERVTREALVVEPVPDNVDYLTTKRERMGHLLEHLGEH